MLNHIVLMGRLTRDPELRRTGSGISVASFTVATDRDYAPEGQEKETDFIDCVAWRQTGEFVSKYFTKGSMIVVSGRLQIRGWTDKDGNKRRTAEIVADNVYFGESKRSADSQQSQAPYTGGQGFQPPQYNQQPQGQQPPQYSQQGFGGYQQGGYPQQSYQAPFPARGTYAQVDGSDPNFPF